MRIVNLEAFLAMPSGTLYAKYEPCVFGPLEIKCESLGSRDFVAQGIVDAISSTDSGDWGDKLQFAKDYGDSLKMDFNCAGRDGCFVDDQLFAVFESDDVSALIERIKQG